MSEALKLIETEATLVELQFGAWHREVRGTIAEALTWEDAWLPPARRRLDERLRSVRGYHQNIVAPFEGGRLRSNIETIVGLAEQDVGFEPVEAEHNRVIDFAFAMIDAAVLDMHEGLRSDHAAAVSAFSRLQMEGSLLQGRGVAANVAFNMAKVGFMKRVTLRRTDHLGRRWDTSVMAYLDVRQTLMDIYNHAFMSTTLDSGSDLAVIQGSDGLGKTFSITGRTPGVPALADVRGMMHPRAKFLVSRA